eukprot:222159_1
MASSRIALVTGGNRGIGLNLVRQLVYRKWRVIMTTRSLDSAHQALKDSFDDDVFPRRNVDVLKLDITDNSSIETAAEYIKQTYNSKLDVLVNNAGIAFRGKQFNSNIVNQTLNTNYYGTINVTRALSPFVTDRIFFVSSRAGALQQYSQKRIDAFLSDNLTENSLNNIVEEFKNDSQHLVTGDMNDEIEIEDKGWTLNAYNLSKAAINMYSRILAIDIEKQKRRVFVGSYCPGHCRTDMTKDNGDRSPVEGAYGLTTMATMLLDYEADNLKRERLKLKDDDLLPFDMPNGNFWTAFYAQEGELNTVEVEPIDWKNPAKTMGWNTILRDFVIRKGKGVLSLEEQASIREENR